MMRVATYNIHKSVGLDFKYNPQRILDVLNEIDTDVAFLQEVDRRIGNRETTLSHELISNYTDYQAINVNLREHSLGWHGNAILVRKNHRILRSWRIELPALEPRGAVAADLMIQGKVVRCVATHLSLLSSVRKHQVSRIARNLDQQSGNPPAIIAGDFNEWRKRKSCMDHFGEEYLIIDSRPTFPAFKPIVPLDRIIVSKEIKPIKTLVHHSVKSKIASDHLPIWADLKLPHLI